LPYYYALVEYDGTDYYGFQRQRENQPTIQGKIEQVLTQLAGNPIQILAAGRTDSGVHAMGQVITFTIEDWRHGTEALQRAINANLPTTIAILKLLELASPLHPRYDARRRAYEYLICRTPVRRPMQRLYSWHVPQPLDVSEMNRAAASLIGVHNFATFGQPPQGDNCVRELFAATWQQRDERLAFFIEANAFLYRMVRSIVGSLKLVGEASWTVEDFVAAFQARDRSRSGMAAPPQGLYLVSVTYENMEIGD
jgi:tRNA pseudouridine38-40 synthase